MILLLPEAGKVDLGKARYAHIRTPWHHHHLLFVIFVIIIIVIVIFIIKRLVIKKFRAALFSVSIFTI